MWFSSEDLIKAFFKVRDWVTSWAQSALCRVFSIPTFLFTSLCFHSAWIWTYWSVTWYQRIQHRQSKLASNFKQPVLTWNRDKDPHRNSSYQIRSVSLDACQVSQTLSESFQGQGWTVLKPVLWVYLIVFQLLYMEYCKGNYSNNSAIMFRGILSIFNFNTWKVFWHISDVHYVTSSVNDEEAVR